MKTQKIIKLIPFLILLLSFTNLSAQNKVSANDTIVADSVIKKECKGLAHSTYIFEGSVISFQHCHIKINEGYSKSYKKTGTTYSNFNSYLVQIQKVIKGKLQVGTIEITEPSYGVIFQGDDDYTISSAYPEDVINMPTSGTILFFCFDTLAKSKSANVSNTNSKTIRYYSAIQFSNDSIKKDPRSNISTRFITLTEFYGYLGANFQSDMTTTDRR